MAAFCDADPEIMVEPWLAELLADRFRSGAKIDQKEYATVIKRLLLAKMAELTATSSSHPLGMFAVWKEVDRIQRLNETHHRWPPGQRVLLTSSRVLLMNSLAERICHASK